MNTELTKSYVEYQSQTRLLELAVEVADLKSLKKDETRKKMNLATKIRMWLKALQYSDYLSKDTIDKLVYALADLSNANAIPYAPVITTVTAPSILVGIAGAQGATGSEGPEGGGIPFSALGKTTSQVIDSFDISVSKQAEWRLAITGSGATSGKRVMRILGGWSSDGLTYGDDGGDGTDDIYGDTTPVTISVQVTGTTAQLYATITSGTWDFEGTRVYIPNTGASVVTPTTLISGYVWVGNSSNVAAPVAVSGDATLSNTGVLTITKAVTYSATSTPQYIWKTIDIGGWDMDTNPILSVAHGIATGVSKIVSVSTKIYDDFGDFWYPIDHSKTAFVSGEPSGAYYVTDTHVVLERVAGGWFDTSDFNASNSSRGEVTILYKT